MNITTLNLGNNRIHSIEPLRDLNKLQTLDLKANQLWNPDELIILREMKQLIFFSIFQNSISMFEESIFGILKMYLSSRDIVTVHVK